MRHSTTQRPLDSAHSPSKSLLLSFSLVNFFHILISTVKSSVVKSMYIFAWIDNTSNQNLYISCPIIGVME